MKEKIRTKFEELFGNTYIGKNPTENRNKYCILRFNFSGISTENIEETIKGFKNSTIESIKLFIAKYNLDFYINESQEAEEILNSLYTAFQIQKANEKIYVIIDEYDHFANELLGFKTEEFKKDINFDITLDDKYDSSKVIIDIDDFYYEIINEEYLRAGTKSKRRRILYELFAFEVLCEEEFGIENKHLWFVDEELLPDNKQYFDIIDRDKKYFFNISISSAVHRFLVFAISYTCYIIYIIIPERITYSYPVSVI